MALRNSLWVVMYGCIDNPDTAIFEANKVTLDAEGNLEVEGKAIFRKDWWLSVEKAESRIKLGGADGS